MDDFITNMLFEPSLLDGIKPEGEVAPHYDKYPLVVLFLHNERGGDVFDLVCRGSYGILTNSHSDVDGESALNFDGANMISLGDHAPALKSPPFTVITIGEYNNAGSTQALFSYSQSGGGNTGWSLKSEQYPGTGAIGFTKHGVADITSSISTPTSGLHAISCIAHSDNDVTVMLDQEHELLGNTAAFNTTGVNNIALGGTRSNGDRFSGKFTLNALIADDIGVDEVKKIHENPMSLIKSSFIFNPYYQAAAGGGNGLLLLNQANSL